jgi:hypothetical protein
VRIATAGPGPGVVSSPIRWVASGIPFAVAGAITILVATKVSSPSIELAIGIPVGIGTAVWMFVSQRMERPLIVFLLYLGLLDGYLKLATDSSAITLGRDALLYAILLGFLARAVLRRQPLALPPLSGWILAFTAVAIIQLINPESHGFVHKLGALRPHLEFVPLFFIGYYMVQTPARLRTFFLIMLLIATANGVVGAIQLELTPSQLAAWGPGYKYRILGTGSGVNQVSGRTFTTSTGEQETRPFGLGDDAGVGAAWGMLALSGVFALASLGFRRGYYGAVAMLLCIGPPLAIITGEGRGYLIASVVVLLAYAALATTPRRLVPTMLALILGLGAIVGVVAFVASSSGSSVFSRYATVTPGKLISTTGTDRGGSYDAIPKLITRHPLGTGLGSVGPAATFAGGGKTSAANGETQMGYLLSELGIPGLIVFYGLNAYLLYLGLTRLRRLDPETRTYIAALLASLIGLLALGLTSATSATSPEAPYFWFAAGALSYWLITALGPGRARGQRAAIATDAVTPTSA